MRTLIVLAVCVSACLAHGNYGGDSGFRSSGRSQGSLIDYPFTVQVSKSSSDNTQYRTLNFPQQQQPQVSSRTFQQPQIRQQQTFQQPQIRQQQTWQQPQIRQQQTFQQPQIRQQQTWQQPQIRQQKQITQQVRQQPSFQIERSQAVASFDWPSPQAVRQVQPQPQQQQQRSFTSGSHGGRQQSQLIDYPFTVEVTRSSGSTGGQGRNYGSQW